MGEYANWMKRFFVCDLFQGLLSELLIGCGTGWYRIAKYLKSEGDVENWLECYTLQCVKTMGLRNYDARGLKQSTLQRLALLDSYGNRFYGSLSAANSIKNSLIQFGFCRYCNFYA